MRGPPPPVPSPSAGVGMEALHTAGSRARPRRSLGPSAMLLPGIDRSGCRGALGAQPVVAGGPRSPQHHVLPVGAQAAPHTLEQAWEAAGTPRHPGLTEPASLPHPTSTGTAALGSELLLFLAVFAQLLSRPAAPCGLLFPDGRSRSMAARQLPRELPASTGAVAEGLRRQWERSFPAKRQLTRTRGCSAAILSLGLIPGGSGAMLRRARFLFAALPASVASYPPHPQAAAGVWGEPGGMSRVG